MIVYKDILAKLSEAGYNTTIIRKDKILSESTLTKIRNNEPIRLDSLELISKLTSEPIENLVEFKWFVIIIYFPSPCIHEAWGGISFYLFKIPLVLKIKL